MKKSILIIYIISIFNIFHVNAQNVDGNKLVSVNIYSDFLQAIPGLDINLFFVLKPEKKWHIYWENPGDAGLPTEVIFELPDGVTVMEPEWETPQKILFAGMANYGYENETTIMYPLRIDRNLKGNEIKVKATVKWLACKEECVPGSKKIEFTVILGKIPEYNEDMVIPKSKFLKNRSLRLPNFGCKSSINENKLIFEIDKDLISKDVKKLEFYPSEQGFINNGAKQILKNGKKKVFLEVELDKFREGNPKEIKGIFVADKPIIHGFDNYSINIETTIH